jgi:hypothetical protein
VVLRNPLLQGHVAEHSRLLLIVAAHKTIIAWNVLKWKWLRQNFFNKFLKAQVSKRWQHCEGLHSGWQHFSQLHDALSRSVA